MKRINLVVLTREYPIEVAGTKRVQHLLEQLLIFETQIKVLSLRSKNNIEHEIGLYNGIQYERISSTVSLTILQLKKVFQYYCRTIKSLHNAKQKGIKNIIYSYGVINIENLIFILYAKIIGYKLIIDIVEDYSTFSGKLKLISKFKIWTLRKLDRLNVLLSDAIVVISTHLQRKYDNMKAKNLTLIPITAKTSSNFKQKKEFNQPFLILYAGSFGDKDGVDLIIEGFIEFNKTFEASLLYLIGSSDQQKKYLDKYQGFQNIIFTGFIPDDEYFPLIQKADVLCMCRTNSAYSNAGFPFKLGEYLATGNPIIATRVSDVELFLSDDDAFLIESDNRQQFINAVLQIISDPIEAFRRGNNGLQICKTKFSPRINGEMLYKLLLKI